MFCCLLSLARSVMVEGSDAGFWGTVDWVCRGRAPVVCVQLLLECASVCACALHNRSLRRPDVNTLSVFSSHFFLRVEVSLICNVAVCVFLDSPRISCDFSCWCCCRPLFGGCCWKSLKSDSYVRGNTVYFCSLPKEIFFIWTPRSSIWWFIYYRQNLCFVPVLLCWNASCVAVARKLKTVYFQISTCVCADWQSAVKVKDYQRMNKKPALTMLSVLRC